MPDGIALRFAFEIRAQIATPVSGGAGRYGLRRIIAITGGTVDGPRLTGRVLPGGADYALRRADGCSRVEAHYVIEADDGTPIYVHNTGLFIAGPEVFARMDAGQRPSAEDYYFRTAPVFDAPDGPHGWLSDRLFVAEARFAPAEVTIRVHEVR